VEEGEEEEEGKYKILLSRTEKIGWEILFSRKYFRAISRQKCSLLRREFCKQIL
jgi:hypothetical protein